MNERCCRVCFKLFCCIKCRMKHEQVKHTIDTFEDCDICRRGRMRFSVTKKYSKNLLTHIQEQHIRLYCRKCKAIYNNINELVEALKCEKRKDNYLHGHSVLISGNTIMPIMKNDNSYVERPRMKVTSTPMGNNNNKDCNMEVVSPTEFQLSNRESNTPTDVTPIYNLNYTNMPVITPLRSIISKSKTNNNTDRHVTFSDMILTQEDGSASKSNQFDILNTPENNRNSRRSSNIVTLDLSPIPSVCSRSVSELFYTPEGPSTMSLQINSNKKMHEGVEARDHMGFRGLFGNITKAITTVIRSVFKSEQVEPQLFYMNTSGSIKRFLSPNADRSVPKLKRICIRGRQPINRTNIKRNDNSK